MSTSSRDNEQLDFGRTALLILTIIGCVLLPNGEIFAADITSTWDGSTGIWIDPNRWDSVDYPNNGNGGFTYDAIVGSGAVTLDQNITIEDLVFSGGTIDGASDLEVLGDLTWTAGAFSGSGVTTIENGTISGVADKQFDNGTLEVLGEVEWSQGEILSTSFGTVVISNGASFTSSLPSSGLGRLEANLIVNNGGSFRTDGFQPTRVLGSVVNEGTIELLNKSFLLLKEGVGSGDLIIRDESFLLFELVDPSDYQFTGQIILDHGFFDIVVFTGTELEFLLPNGLVGTGTFSGDVLVNSTEIAPGNPTADITSLITIDADYEQTTSGLLSFDIDGTDPNDFDRIEVIGTATLSGTLEVTLDDVADAPIGTVFEVMTTDSITGTFDDVITTGVDDIILVPSYGTSPFSALGVGAHSSGASVYLTSVAEGDMNPFVAGIGEEDAVAFALALTDPDTYRNTYGISADEAGDIDDIGDNGLDFDDIDDFVRILNQHIGGTITMARMFQIIEEAQAVPEPAATQLVLLASLSVVAMRGRIWRGRCQSLSGEAASARTGSCPASIETSL